MEIHHQHHHDHPQHKEKVWKHYALEFFMLFLAVFCGFLAENFREHVVEHEREKQYMQSMVEDLTRDTTEINSTLYEIDSLLIPVFHESMALLYLEDYSDSTVKKMYEYVPKSITFLSVNFEKRTKTQLENSGNLRLIRSQQVTDSLAEYWKACDVLEYPVLPGYAEIRSKAKELVYTLFSMKYYKGNLPFSTDSTHSALNSDHPQLISTDRVQFIKLANYISNLSSQSIYAIRGNLLFEKSKAGNLIKLIKANYHLE